MMLEIARAGTDGAPVSMTAVARSTDVSKSYLEQLAVPLKAARLLKGRPGRAGGYTLARSAADIRIREIVEATLGPIDLVECVGNPDHCLRAGECETRLIWALLTHRVRAMLDDYSLADLTNPDYLQDIRETLGAALVMPRRRGRSRAKTTCGPEPARPSRRRPVGLE
jgi:Rrf2 family protein